MPNITEQPTSQDVQLAVTMSLNKLRRLANQQHIIFEINQQLLSLIENVEALEPSPLLHKQLEWTYSLLIGELFLDEYLEKAQETKAEDSLLWNIFAGIMLAVVLTTLVIGIGALVIGVIASDSIFIMGGLSLSTNTAICATQCKDFLFFNSKKVVINDEMNAFYKFKVSTRVEYNKVEEQEEPLRQAIVV